MRVNHDHIMLTIYSSTLYMITYNKYTPISYIESSVLCVNYDIKYRTVPSHKYLVIRVIKSKNSPYSGNKTGLLNHNHKLNQFTRNDHHISDNETRSCVCHIAIAGCLMVHMC